eukprot:TRINITY_DN34897_c0_g1_i1.p1 TRINITY_DN34897_c0_g1~~TRINITY_DN34897_c0_g1_i1.p1  ORF type:complete len:384 (+),score=65.21 TRINITY_DN34897_c0_g1_i1:46-1197(+)
MSISELLDYLRLDFPDVLARGLVARDIATATELFAHDIERLRDDGILPQRHCRRIARYILRNGRQFPPLPLVSDTEESETAWQAEMRTRSPAMGLAHEPHIVQSPRSAAGDSRIEIVLRENEQLKDDVKKLREMVFNIEKQLQATRGANAAREGTEYKQQPQRTSIFAEPPAPPEAMHSPPRPHMLPRSEAHVPRADVRNQLPSSSPPRPCEIQAGRDRLHQHAHGMSYDDVHAAPYETPYERPAHSHYDQEREARRRANSGRIRMMSEHIAMQQREVAEKANKLKQIEERHLLERERERHIHTPQRAPQHDRMWEDRERDSRATSAMTRIEERARAALPSAADAIKAMEERLALRRSEVDASRQRLLQVRQQGSDTVDRRIY